LCRNGLRTSALTDDRRPHNPEVVGDTPTEAGEALQRLELIASYLLPLKLTDERYPVEEHARLASEIIRTRGV